jgi:hypothetical protein
MLGLTVQERQVILFLISVALIGTGANFFFKKYTPVQNILCLNQDIGKISLNSADRGLPVVSLNTAIKKRVFKNWKS